MAKFRLWVSGDEGVSKVALTDTDDKEATKALLGSLLDVAGGTGFDLGVTIGMDGVTPPPVPAEVTHATEAAQQRTEATRGAKGNQSHWKPGQEPK